jgi:Ca2+-binding EF-hand superfamily protein
MVKQGDQNASGDLDLAEFVHYMMAHEKRLKLVFSKLDRNQDGTFDKRRAVEYSKLELRDVSKHRFYRFRFHLSRSNR